MTASSFQVPPQLPIAFCHTPSSIIQLIKDSIEVSRKRLNTIAATEVSRVSIQNALLPLAEDENATINAGCIPCLYTYVSDSKELREASAEADKLMDAYNLEAASREDLYKIVQSLQDGTKDLDAEAQHYLKKKNLRFIRNGLNLNAVDKKRFEVLKARITSLSADCNRNLREESGGIWFTAAELYVLLLILVLSPILSCALSSENSYDDSQRLTVESSKEAS
jgi:metallopeptidase MepB